MAARSDGATVDRLSRESGDRFGDKLALLGDTIGDVVGDTMADRAGGARADMSAPVAGQCLVRLSSGMLSDICRRQAFATSGRYARCSPLLSVL